MAHRTPHRAVDPVADTVQHEWTQPIFLGYDPAGPDGKHRHDGRAAHTHDDDHGREPHVHDPASDKVILIQAPASPRPDSSQDDWFDSGEPNQSTADPSPSLPWPEGASPETPPGDGAAGGAGRPRDDKGRFLPNGSSRDMVRWYPNPDVVRFQDAVIEQVMIDAEAVTYRYEQNAQVRVLLFESAAAGFADEVDKVAQLVDAVHDSAPWYQPRERAS